MNKEEFLAEWNRLDNEQHSLEKAAREIKDKKAHLTFAFAREGCPFKPGDKITFADARERGLVESVGFDILDEIFIIRYKIANKDWTPNRRKRSAEAPWSPTGRDYIKKVEA